MASFEFIAIIVSVLGLAASITYYAIILNNANKTRELQLKAQQQAEETRQTQLFMTIFRELNSEKNWNTWIELIQTEIPDYETFQQKYDSKINREHFGKRSHIWYSLHAIGYLLKFDVIPIELINDLVGLPTILLWRTWGDTIKEIRIRQGLPKYFDGFEYLYNELVEYQREHPEMRLVNYDIIEQIKF